MSLRDRRRPSAANHIRLALAPLCASLVLTAAVLACASPLSPATLVPAETGVALTLQAIAAAATPIPSPAPAASPTAVPDVLPHDLYFLNRDAAGLQQVFRLAADGINLQQITFEPFNVDGYAVSARDGSVAFVTDNQLYLVDAAGAGRRLLIDGGPLDEDNRWTDGLSAPVWSPDGRTLAYGHGGLSFLDPVTGAVTRVLQNQIDTSAGFAIVKEHYAPIAYSADGSKLLIQIGFYEGGTYGIYLPPNRALVRFQRPEGGIVCCYVNWIPDGSGVYITAPSLGMFESGLYHADAATGAVTALLPGSLPDGTYNFALAAQVGADNQLYFFFNNLSQIPTEGHTPLVLVRSAPDGATDRTQLLPDAFQNINEVLWAPDASLAVLTVPLDPNVYDAGELRVVYPDGRPAITLPSLARNLHWGP
jgi:hypothetical protein